MPRLVLRRAVGPHAVSVNRNSGEFGSVVAVALPSLRSRDHCRVRFAISHMMHAHIHTCVCVSCSRLISIFRLPHSLVKGPQRLPASPSLRLLIFLVRIRSLTRALRRLIKIAMERERAGRGRGRAGRNIIADPCALQFALRFIIILILQCIVPCLLGQSRERASQDKWSAY